MICAINCGSKSASNLSCNVTDPFHCETFRQGNLCSWCLGTDHNKGEKCLRKNFPGDCGTCMIPKHLHKGPLGQSCKTGYNTWAVCWAMFHSETWKTELFREFRDAPKDALKFAAWIAEKRDSGLPNSVYVYMWAVETGGIFH